LIELPAKKDSQLGESFFIGESGRKDRVFRGVKKTAGRLNEDGPGEQIVSRRREFCVKKSQGGARPEIRRKSAGHRGTAGRFPPLISRTEGDQAEQLAKKARGGRNGWCWGGGKVRKSFKKESGSAREKGRGTFGSQKGVHGLLASTENRGEDEKTFAKRQYTAGQAIKKREEPRISEKKKKPWNPRPLSTKSIWKEKEYEKVLESQNRGLRRDDDQFPDKEKRRGGRLDVERSKEVFVGPRLRKKKKKKKNEQ